MDFNNTDPQAINLAKAIRATETNGRFEASNPDAGGWSVGAYQWHGKDEAGARQHFQAEASQFGLDPHDFSAVNQDKVAYAKIKSWKDHGYHADEIAALWNGAKMVNGRPVAINPAYVEKVKKNFGVPSNQSPPGGQQPATTYDPAPFGTGAGKIDLSQNQPLVDKQALGDSVKSGTKAVTDAVGNAVGQVATKDNAKKAAGGLLHGALDFGKGLVKGTGQVLDAPAKGIANAISHKLGVSDKKIATGNAQADTTFHPSNTTQKVGAFVGRDVLPTTAAGMGVGSLATAAGVDVPALVGSGVNAAKTVARTGLKAGKFAAKGALFAEALAHPKQVLGLLGHLMDLIKSGVE